MSSDGRFLVAWQSFGQEGGADYGVYARRYNAAGAAVGGEFRANSSTALNQSGPAVAADGAGDFVVAWQSDGQDGSGYGVYAQRVNTNDAPTSAGLPNVTTAEDTPAVVSL